MPEANRTTTRGTWARWIAIGHPNPPSEIDRARTHIDAAVRIRPELRASARAIARMLRASHRSDSRMP